MSNAFITGRKTTPGGGGIELPEWTQLPQGGDFWSVGPSYGPFTFPTPYGADGTDFMWLINPNYNPFVVINEYADNPSNGVTQVSFSKSNVTDTGFTATITFGGPGATIEEVWYLPIPKK